jgi:uncharacterized membrane protein YqhA
MWRQVLVNSRYLVLIAVAGSLIGSIVVLIYGGLSVASLTVSAFRTDAFTTEGARQTALHAIELIDLFLLGTVLLIVALGLYELFIDEGLPTPGWLVIASLEDLKEKLLRVVIVMLGVTFLGHVVMWDGSARILHLGVSIGAVLAALSLLVRRQKAGRDEYTK